MRIFLLFSEKMQNNGMMLQSLDFLMLDSNIPKTDKYQNLGRRQFPVGDYQNVVWIKQKVAKTAITWKCHDSRLLLLIIESIHYWSTFFVTEKTFTTSDS